jgi:hypothetical protein
MEINDNKRLSVGDTLVASWGYDQQNIDFYKVVGMTASGKSVKVAHMGEKIVTDHGIMAETVVPNGVIDGPTLTRKINAWHGVKIDSVRYASKWSGQPELQTHTH